MFSSFTPIPIHLQKRYLLLRVLMYGLLAFITALFTLRVLFPIIDQSFDFRTSASSRNTIGNPRAPDNNPRLNGKIEAHGTLIANTPVTGNFSIAQTTITLEKKSAIPSHLSFSLRRSYQSFLYPIGTAVSDFPPIDQYSPQEIIPEQLYVIDGAYYVSQKGTLYPFVSEQAYLSRYPKERALITDQSLFDYYSVSDRWLGFRVGSLLSNANGVFVVTSETEVRPIGSADIFLALGYNFSDVIPVNEEELGIYKRGRIMLLGTPHPDGAIFFDQDTTTDYVIFGGMKHPLLGIYRDFLLRMNHPIIASSVASEVRANCTLIPSFFGRSFSCTTNIEPLTKGFGDDFELTLSDPDSNIDLGTLSVSFETAKNRQNMLTLLSQIKQRFLSRFGYGSPQ